MTARKSTGQRTGLQIGVIGLGFISDFHLAALRRVAPQASLVGCDVAPALGEQALAAGKIDDFVTDVDALIERGVDAALVLVPPQLHLAIGGPLLDAGVDVLMEKPFATSTSECDELISRAAESGALLAVGHNQLFYDRWLDVKDAIADGTIGTVRSIDMVSRRPLPFLRAGDGRPWMMRAPRNILFEVAPHAFAQVLDIAPGAVVASAVASTPMDVDGRRFYANWTIAALDGDVPISVSLSFEDAQAQTWMVLRGTLGSIVIDFDLNTVEVVQRNASPFDVEKLSSALGSARQRAVTALATFASVVRHKAGSNSAIDPFTGSIASSAQSFLEARETRAVDPRHAADLGRAVVSFGEQIAQASGVDEAPVAVESTPAAPQPVASTRVARSDAGPRQSVLVLGATGFIGQAVVERLAEEHSVTVVARNPVAARQQFEHLDVEVQAGDLGEPEALGDLLAKDQTVIHLAYSGSTEWDDLVAADIEPTIALARLAGEVGVRRFIYASSIAIYDAGDGAETITEHTPPSDGVMRSSAYARSKVETERRLGELDGGPPIVVTRPGVVVGAGSDPCHWGVAAWPHTNVCKHWSSGDETLPLVLVTDVAEAYAALVHADAAIDGSSYNLCGPGLVTARMYVEEMARCSGTPIRQIDSSPAVAYGGALAKWALKRLGDSSLGRPSYSDHAGRTFAANFECAKAQGELGWKPADRVDEVLRTGVCEPAAGFVRNVSLVQ